MASIEPAREAEAITEAYITPAMSECMSARRRSRNASSMARGSNSSMKAA